MRLYDPAKPPSGGIPRFPLWEVIVTIFMIYYGVVGLLRLNDSRDTLFSVVFNGYAMWWFLAIAISGIVSLIGMAVPAPTGFLLHVIGMSILSLVSIVAIVGLSVEMSTVFFPGSTLLIIFSVGGVLRLAQLMHQLFRLSAAVKIITEPTVISEGGGN